VRQQWFSVGIFSLGQFFGLTRNRSQSVSPGSFKYLTEFSEIIKPSN
jgi:hypothetical protein